MKLLAIDCGGAALSAALAENGRVLAERGSREGLAHSLGLLPLVERLLAEQGISLAELDAFACTVGPGSFTGLRIGCATVQGWGFALDKPVLAVSSTQAMALTASSDGYTCPIFDARRDELYAAIFHNGQRQCADLAIAPLRLCRQLQALEAPVLLAGDGLPHYQQLFQQELGANFRAYDGLYMAPAAAIIACEQAARGQLLSPPELLPRYLRLSEAEEKRLAREEAAHE